MKPSKQNVNEDFQFEIAIPVSNYYM